MDNMFDYKPYILSLANYMRDNGYTAKRLPKVILDDTDQGDDVFVYTGYFDPEKKGIRLFIHNRHPKDVLRTLAHELIHWKQDVDGIIEKSGYTGDKITEDKNLRDIVFNQSIFSFNCNNCGTESLIEYPFIYHDYEKKFFVYFDTSKNFENVIESEGYKTRTASNYLDFLEIIRILEDGVEEDKINVAKIELFNKFKNNDKLKNIDKLYYTGTKDNKLEFFVPAINGKIVF
jgi:hypothetical protein